jgi:hypothetical protein
MKTKRSIKLLSLLMVILILILSLPLSIFAEETNIDSEHYYDQENEVMNCAPPVYLVPIIIAIVPLAFCFEMFESFMQGDFTILYEIPQLFTSVWTAVF